MSELKPCPFCGGEADIVFDWFDDYGGCRIECTQCGAAVDTAAAWNTRHVETCKDLGGTDENGQQVFDCDACGCVLSLYDRDGTNTLCTGFIYDYPRYCPSCGRKVEQ